MFATNCGLIIAGSLFFSSFAGATEAQDSARIEAVVESTIVPMMSEHHIPGMAIALSVNGAQYYFNYGLADQEGNIPVTADTLFELGSVSKVFTAALAAYAQSSGTLSFSDTASQHLPSLEGSAFDEITLLELGTYTAGGLPLQFPEDVTNKEEMMDYYRHWQPDFPPGNHRLYSNPSIGLFGYLAAQSLGQPFETLMASQIFAPLGLEHSYYAVPESQQANYAYGYSKDNVPIRVNPGVLDAEAYGLKATAADVLAFIEAQMAEAVAVEPLHQALATTRMGYVGLGGMVQGLGWESYDYPVSLDQLLEGNSVEVVLEANQVERFEPPLPSREEALFNKTGSTNGFGAYVAFVPSQQVGIALLANRNYPNQARIQAAHHILTALDKTH
ncbi:class C beta-lactamase [Vreelandella olivaria]|uniref:class C beta-lactamase n=1 Tax=Vreelandella olivaria TaxID=390919 RepID=UPI00201F7901|nr:class C beta-lactamase [Halomonas olivaria]